MSALASGPDVRLTVGFLTLLIMGLYEWDGDLSVCFLWWPHLLCHDASFFVVSRQIRSREPADKRFRQAAASILFSTWHSRHVEHFSRLDDIFFVVATITYIPLLQKGFLNKLRGIALLVGPTGCALLVYLGFHYFTDQSLLPTSGSVKIGSLKTVLVTAANFAFTFVAPSGDYWLNTGYSSSIDWLARAVRIIPIVVPAVLSLMVAWWLLAMGRSKKWMSPYLIFAPLPVYVLLKALYACKMELMMHGYWYFSLSILFTNLLLAGIVLIGLRNSQSQHNVVRGLPSLFVGVILVMIYLVDSGSTIFNAGQDSKYFQIWKARSEIETALRSVDPGMKLIDCHDGFLSYVLASLRPAELHW